jgi:DNA-nicking Smr family endonuclease
MTKRARPKRAAKTPLDGDALFAAAMQGAAPLKRRPAKAPEKSPAPPRPSPPGAGRPRPTSVRPAPPPPAAGAGPWAPAGLDKRNAERLRRGQMTIEGRLDLHGHTQADAHRAAHAFVAASQRAGRRCVLIITGKGGARDKVDAGFMPDRDSGVLRRNLPRWLDETPVRHMVLRLQTARPQHGGEGAYYVLLRRKR